ncbi:hypothetical protein VTJ49DRAFT_2597 [Mycothermus thermophilus]|uniref:Vacuolar protein sorting-associated protein 51 homolog n=1 Tax=Humicola insolens TaxID=85995 RepID=A0ABR3V9K2_HUMIN
MSTIASPRDPGGPFPRRANSSIITPTSSTRPSLDITPSGSPNPTITSSSTTTTAAANPQSKRATRAALREYYNLRNTPQQPPPPTVQITDLLDPASSSSSSTSPFHHGGPPTQPPSELDDPSFDAEAYTARLLREGSLADLLRAYTRALTEMRALDAERKALVYDNYSKLIAATETIRRMRGAAAAAASSSAGTAGAGTEGSEEGSALVAGGGAAALDAVVERIYVQARGLREGLRERVGDGGAAATAGGEGRRDAKARTRELAREVVQVPERVRRLVVEGKEEEARREWELPRRLLVRWRELGVGGEDVGKLIEEGDAALRSPDEEEGREGRGVRE